MLPEPSKEPSRFLLILKWGGCFTALVFAVGGLLLDFASPDDAYETLSRGSWVIVAVSMAIGFTGVILDRSDELPKL
jgi:putative copper export protein